MIAREMLLGSSPPSFFAWNYDGVLYGFDLKKVLTFRVVRESSSEGYPDTCVVTLEDSSGTTAEIEGKENIEAFFKIFFNVYGDGPNTIAEFFTQEK